MISLPAVILLSVLLNLEVEEKPEPITFACMIKRNPANLDYSVVKGDPAKEQLVVSDERMDFIDKRLVSLFNEV